MRLLSYVYLLAALLPATLGALSEYDNLKVVNNFSHNFLYPNSLVQAEAVNSTLFAEDVVGTVDATTHFDGRELNTEYMFGLFARLNVTGPSFLGIPIDYEVVGLLVENENVVADVIFTFYYPALDKKVPLELITFFTINEDREITEYSTTFRYWSWASDIYLPEQIPMMAEWLNITSYENSTEVLQTYLAHQTCTGATQFCTGDNTQYDSYDHCMQWLRTEVPIGKMYRLGDNNLACRFLHVGMLELRPEVHCAHVGPSGGDMCIARNYTEVVTTNHYPKHGFIGPLEITDYNRESLKSVKMNGQADVSQQFAILMERGNLHAGDITILGPNVFIFFVLIWATARFTHGYFYRRDWGFTNLNIVSQQDAAYKSHVRPFCMTGIDQFTLMVYQREIVMFTISTFWTTVCLVMELVAAPTLIADTPLWAVKLIRVSAVLLCVLYSFELAYRIHMPIEVIGHRLLAIFVVVFSVTAFGHSLQPIYLAASFAWILMAVTEQVTLVGLVLFRFHVDTPRTGLILRFAAIQTGIFKVVLGVGVVLFGIFGKHFGYAPIPTGAAFLFALGSINYVAYALIGSWLTWKLSQKEQFGAILLSRSSEEEGLVAEDGNRRESSE